MPAMIKLYDGSEVTAEEFYRWTATAQRYKLLGQSPEHHAARTAAVQTEETRAKMRAAWDRRKANGVSHTMSDEARARISTANKGKVVSEETRKKMSAAHQGKSRGKASAETKAKQSAALRVSWAARRALKPVMQTLTAEERAAATKAKRKATWAAKRAAEASSNA